MIKVLLDANVWYAAAKSPLGGSGMVLAFCRARKIQAYVSREILKEAERNIRQKESQEILRRHYQNLRTVKLEFASIDKEQSVKKYQDVINPKDALVLSAAVNAEVDHLITLDRKHFFTEIMSKQEFGFSIILPGDLIQELFEVMKSK